MTSWLALGLAGCGSGGGGGETGNIPTRQVTAADFASPDAPPVAKAPEPARAAPTIDAERARNGKDDVVVIMGAPSTPRAVDPAVAAASPAPLTGAESRLLVDQLVGQINGRPVFANEFFAPMDERFRREATRMKERDWLQMAKKDIDAALWDKLRDDLLLAEFETALTPEQRMGILAFIETVRSDLISGNLGSEAQANINLLENEGIDLDTKVSDISKRRFILEQLRRAIGDRVQVSYWDVRLYYEQHLDEFVPPPTAQFVILRVSKSNEEQVARVDAALSARERFSEIAARESTWRPDAGNGHSTIIKSRDYAQERHFGPEPLNGAVLGLKPGQITERIELGADYWWIELVSIEAPAGRSLYDAQTDIEVRLKNQRQREEEIRYFDQLFRRGSFSDVKQMSGRLLTFAAERYLIQDRMRAGSASAGAEAPVASTPAPTPTPAEQPAEPPVEQPAASEPSAN